MNRERWQRIEALFQTAAARPTQERATFLEEACGGDTSLRQEVEALLASDTQSDAEFEEFASALAADWLVTSNQYDLVGQTIGHYRLLSGLAAGGMGEVYLGEDLTLDRKVALKFLPKHFTRDAQRLHRFEKEARAASALNHPNILTIYQFGEWQGTRFIATEYIEGETLRERLEKGRLPLPEVFEIGSQVAGALAAAHDAGLIHRDIKPANIMLRTDGYVKVLDFGLVKLTRPTAQADVTEIGRVIGTANYMSPEQALGEPLDHRTDIYSLGVVLYEMATGHRLLDAQKEGAVDEGVPHRGPTSMRGRDHGLREDLEQVIRRALARDRDSRYQSATALANDLRELAHGRGQSQAAERSLRADAPTKWRVAKRSVATIAALSFVIAAGAAFYFSSHRPNAPAIPEKSIAVLPFKNLSANQENAFFTDGVQDEILTDLARIADLKVISRTSVRQYKTGAQRNLREIGQQLGVAHVVEGSVQRAANKVRVNAQLVDARTDAHLWAQTYDRDLADVFAIQSEIAKAIADQLQAKLSPNEKAAIEKPPTTDVSAFDLYSRAKTLNYSVSFSAAARQNLLQAADLLDQAVARDPAFFQAYCLLVITHGNLYSLDHTPERLALAEKALASAFRFQPDAGETHLARADLFRGRRDYEGALRELEIARRTLPNEPRIVELTGYIRRRQGHHEEGLRNLERSLELDPRNFFTLQQIALSYWTLRRYSDMAAALNRALAIKPDDADTQVARGVVELVWKADTRPLHQTIESIRAKNPAALPSIANNWLICALAERDPAAVAAALAALGDGTFGNDAMQFHRSFGEGLLARMSKDEAKARAAFTAARVKQEKIVQAQPDYAPALCPLGVIDAGLGRKEEALSEGRRAIEMLPVANDPFNGAHMIEYFAVIAAWVGEKELACEQLETALRFPGYGIISYGQLKLSPLWDPLRGDPCFEKIVASLAPKDAK